MYTISFNTINNLNYKDTSVLILLHLFCGIWLQSKKVIDSIKQNGDGLRFLNLEPSVLFGTVALLTMSVTYIIAKKNKNKHSLFKHIPIYIISLLMAYILGSAKYLFHDSKIYSYFFSGLAAYTDYFLAFIELIVFSNFY